MKRKSLKKRILACTLSLALAVGSVPVMSLAEDAAVADGQEFTSEEEQIPVEDASSGERRIYDPKYDFDANLITLPVEERGRSLGNICRRCGTAGYVYGCGTGHAGR